MGGSGAESFLPTDKAAEASVGIASPASGWVAVEAEYYFSRSAADLGSLSELLNDRNLRRQMGTYVIHFGSSECLVVYVFRCDREPSRVIVTVFRHGHGYDVICDERLETKRTER